jgi:hypothetical protein
LLWSDAGVDEGVHAGVLQRGEEAETKHRKE